MNFDRWQISNEFVPLVTLFLSKSIYAYMRTRVRNCKLSRLTVIRAIDVSIAKLHGNRTKMILLFIIYIYVYILILKLNFVQISLKISPKIFLTFDLLLIVKLHIERNESSSRWRIPIDDCLQRENNCYVCYVFTVFVFIPSLSLLDADAS